MFYFYGRKKKIAHLYQEPTHSTIIEPFAGSAAYSLHGERWKKDVMLYDVDPVVIAVWKYLTEATADDIQRLPDMNPGDSLVNFQSLSQSEKWLIGFHLNPGSATPKLTASKFSRWGAGKKYLIGNIHKVKHWKVDLKDYRDIKYFPKATWFVDPPYSIGGKHYRKSKIDYPHLAQWSHGLKGQVIVAEGGGADWLPFSELTRFAGIGKRFSSEVVFYGSGSR